MSIPLNAAIAQKASALDMKDISIYWTVMEFEFSKKREEL